MKYILEKLENMIEDNKESVLTLFQYKFAESFSFMLSENIVIKCLLKRN